MVVNVLHKAAQGGHTGVRIRMMALSLQCLTLLTNREGDSTKVREGVPADGVNSLLLVI